MFETLQKAPADKIFALMAAYAGDPRATKIDLGIGVYKAENGTTPIMGAIAKAEARLLEKADTKTYIGVAGNKGFCDAAVKLALGEVLPRQRVAAVQAVGGTGALWILMQLLKKANPEARLWISDPSWANHRPMTERAGLKARTYPYFDPETRTVRFEAMLETLDGLGPDDIVLLHGCCHNPTGANLTPDQWDAVAQSLARTGAIPFIDLAYQGFGDGLEEDAYGTRAIAARVPEFLLATSCSKNFGVYRERVGCAIAVGRDQEAAPVLASQMAGIIRASYSQPPDHGAELVRMVLEDPELRAEWEAELDAMRARMIGNRQALAEAIRARSNAADFDFVADHRGMFSLLGLSAEAVEQLKEDDAVYMLDDSRINVAGLGARQIEALAEALGRLG